MIEMHKIESNLLIVNSILILYFLKYVRLPIASSGERGGGGGGWLLDIYLGIDQPLKV